MFDSQPAYYCIIQYTPEQDRMEGVNVGVVLFCPKLSYLGVQITALFDRAVRFFGPEVDEEEVWENADGIQYRLLHIEAEHMNTLADLQHFVDTRANQIILTQPRQMTLRQLPQEELLRLFRDLVDDRPEALTSTESAAQESGNGAVSIPESPTVAVPNP